jgi:hypothetical protein
MGTNGDGDSASAGTKEKMNAGTWMKIGEHSSQEALKQTAKKIRSKWAGRYDFEICPCREKEAWELRLRHRD